MTNTFSLCLHDNTVAKQAIIIAADPSSPPCYADYAMMAETRQKINKEGRLQPEIEQGRETQPRFTPTCVYADLVEKTACKSFA